MKGCHGDECTASSHRLCEVNSLGIPTHPFSLLPNRNVKASIVNLGGHWLAESEMERRKWSSWPSISKWYPFIPHSYAVGRILASFSWNSGLPSLRNFVCLGLCKLPVNAFWTNPSWHSEGLSWISDILDNSFILTIAVNSENLRVKVVQFCKLCQSLFPKSPWMMKEQLCLASFHLQVSRQKTTHYSPPSK